MPAYPRLASLAKSDFEKGVVPYLVDVWLADYERSSKAGDDIVTATQSGFHFLFDVTHGRLIAAWGISQGRHGGDRDHSRMRSHPQSAGVLYHRGHAIPHRLGGSTDINLVSQRGSLNIGAFRQLENQAVKTPGALYFTYWMYGPGTDQKPIRVEQGLLVPGHESKVTPHSN